MTDLGTLVADLPLEQQAIKAKCFHPGGSFIEFSKEEVEQSIPARFERIVRKYPDRIAVKTRACILTYDALNKAANRVAWAILQQGGSTEQPVALLFEPGAPFIIASLGVLKAGRIQVPLDGTFPRARLCYMLEQSEAALLVTNNANLPVAHELNALAMINIDELDGGFATTNPGLRLPPDANAAIAYTSGSTGRPKGIVWNHRGVLHAVMRHTNTYRVCVQDRLVMFRTSLRPHLYALLNGAAYYPVSLREEEPAGLADWMVQEEITVYRAAVSVFRSFASTLSGAEKFPHLRMILLFGEPVYHTDVESYRRHFDSHCILASSLGCNEFDDYACFFVEKSAPLTSDVVPGGYVIGDTEVLILDDSGRAVGVDQIGEIVIRSPYNAVGYWRLPDLTQAAFLRDPAGGAACLYRTGDLGRMRPDGCLLHGGRKDFQVKIRGHRVEVAEVETTLLDLEGVKEAVVVGREEVAGDRRLVAYIIPTSPHGPRVSDLRRVLGEKLPDYMVPSSFVLLDALPLTATGKVDRRALPPPDGTRPALDSLFAAPRTPVQQKLALIWAEVLGLDRVGIHDDFLELGGDSLLATQVISRVLMQFQTPFPLRDLFDAPTVAEMAVEIERFLETIRSHPETVEQREFGEPLAELETMSEQEGRFSNLNPPASE